MTIPASRILTSVQAAPLNHTVAGTIAELIVAADLTARGWDVFWPFVRNTRFDILACHPHGEIVRRIEVRAGQRRKGVVTFNRKNGALFDHYAIVVAGEPVIYRPELPSAINTDRLGHAIKSPRWPEK